MTPEDYLFYSIKLKAHLTHEWVIRAFSIFRDTHEIKPEPGKLIREPYGFFFFNESLEKVAIEAKRSEKEPLFKKADVVKVSKEQVPCIAESGYIETTLSRLLLNLYVIQEAFNGRLPYINRPFSPRDVEAMISKTLKDTPEPGEARKDGFYYVDEKIRFDQAVTFVKGFSTLFSHSVTAAGLMPAPGRKEFIQTTLKEFKDRNADLTNPVEMVAFEDRLKEFDNAYLKANDPSYGKFMSGKAKDARLKTYMTQGGEANNFTGEIALTPILTPLDQGMVLKQDEFTAASNVIRYGSFARGAETVNGGVTAKAIMNAADTWQIIDTDCGVTYGAEVFLSEKEIHHLVGCTVIEGKAQKKIETIEDAKPYINKPVTMRSPQFCKLSGTKTCKVCATDPLAKYPNGQIIPLMEVSSGIMNDSLKQMHNVSLSKKKVDWATVIS